MYENMYADTERRYADEMEKYQLASLEESGKTPEEFYADIHEANIRNKIWYARACAAEAEARAQ